MFAGRCSLSAGRPSGIAAFAATSRAIATRMAEGDPGRDDAAEVVADERDVRQVQLEDQRLEVVDVGRQVVAASRGVSLLPKPMWSGAMTRWRSRRAGISSRNR